MTRISKAQIEAVRKIDLLLKTVIAKKKEQHQGVEFKNSLERI